MLLQKTTSRFKNFISLKKNKGTDDNYGQLESDEKTPKRHSRPQSWMSQSHAGNEPTSSRSPSNLIEPRMEAHPIARSRTAHSSSSSLCSCDCEADALTPHSLSTITTNISERQPQPRILYLEPQRLARAGDVEKWNKISDPASKPPSSNGSLPPVPSVAPVSTFSLLEALSFEPIDRDPTQLQSAPTQENLAMAPKKSKNWASKVGKFITETDAAFTAISFVNTEGRGALELEMAKKEMASRSATPSSNRSPRSSTSIKKQSTASATSSHSALPPKESTSRSKLKMFSWIEANQMLKPLNPSPSNSERNTSSETTASMSADVNTTPVDPFHLDWFSARLATPSPPIIQSSKDAFESPRSVPLPGPPKPRHQRTPSNHINIDTFISPLPAINAEQANDNNPLQFRNLTFPSPPQPQSPGRSTPRPPILPSIPEVSPLTPTLKQTSYSTPISPQTGSPLLSGTSTPNPKITSAPHSTTPLFRRAKNRRSQKKGLLRRTSSLLESTPFSQNSPLFRHGSIRLNPKTTNADIDAPYGFMPKHGNIGKSAPKEETAPLDWTAFQMAVAGGAGDYLMSGELDDSRQEAAEELEREIDGMIEWWGGFGFPGEAQGIGGLAREERSATSSRHRHGLRMRSLAEHVQQRLANWPPQGVAELPSTERLERKNAAHVELEDTSVAKREQGYESDYSLPDSPMEEITQEAIQRKGSVVLMGSNLHHDLPDFLKWGAKNTVGLIMPLNISE